MCSNDQKSFHILGRDNPGSSIRKNATQRRSVQGCACKNNIWPEMPVIPNVFEGGVSQRRPWGAGIASILRIVRFLPECDGKTDVGTIHQLIYNLPFH